jgi:hypothetical protein
MRMHSGCARERRAMARVLSSAGAAILLCHGTLSAQDKPEGEPEQSAFPLPASAQSTEETPVSDPVSPLEAAPPEPPAPPPPPNGTPIPDGSAPPAPVPPAFPPAIPSLDYGARMRIGARFQDPANPKSLSSISGTADADLYMSGQIHRMLKWQLGLTIAVNGAPGSSSSVNATLLDAIARFEPLPELNIFAGRMIVTADRFVPSGPWGMDEWFYPGLIPGIAAPALPKSGANGRDFGANVWGALLGGHAKYFVGAYQLQDPQLKPLWSGRFQVSLLSPEPAFYQRTTYYGDKDLVSVGVGAQFQKDGSVAAMAMPTAAMPMPAAAPAPDNHSEFNADLVIDKKLGTAGTLSVVGAAYVFGGDNRVWKSLYMGSVGFLFPQVIGIGKLRPSVRFQQAQFAAGRDPSTVIDVQLGYVVMNWWARFALGYRRSSVDLGRGAVAGNMLFLGVTLADP